MKCWFTNREKGTTHDHLREPHENKNYILIILISPLVDNPLTAPIRREYTTQKIRTSSASKAKHIIIEKRPTSDCTTTHITELSFCFPSSAKSTSGTQLLIVDIFFLLSSLIQFSLPSWIYALVFSIILVGRETGVFSDNNIRGFFFRLFFDPYGVCFLPILQVSLPSSTSLFLFAYFDLSFFMEAFLKCLMVLDS